MLKKVLFLFLFYPAVLLAAEDITLNLAYAEEEECSYIFYIELLETALTEAGHSVALTESQIPRSRIHSKMETGDLSLYWLLESEERNDRYISTEVGLTGGLIGCRILFIRQEDQYLYDGVGNLDDFRALNLVGGMGENWFDIKVWEANGLPYKVHPVSWKAIYKMIPVSRGYDYFSRGFNEIIAESEIYPDLAIEKKLMLVYEKDQVFYLSKSGPNAGAPYENLIKRALEQARDSGLIDRLVRKYHQRDFEILDYDNRTKLYLQTPE